MIFSICQLHVLIDTHLTSKNNISISENANNIQRSMRFLYKYKEKILPNYRFIIYLSQMLMNHKENNFQIRQIFEGAISL